MAHSRKSDKGVRDEREFLLHLLPKNSVGAEIGVHLGDFSQLMLEIVCPIELHLIDPWIYEESETYRDALYGGKAPGGQREMDGRYASVCARFKQVVASGCVIIHRGSSCDILREFPEEYFDWIYVDGNHQYKYVKQDLELSFRKTKLGGYVAGDDYGHGGWWNWGVKRAVDEFARADPPRPIVIAERQFMFRKA
jgi:hypothetical protein